MKKKKTLKPRNFVQAHVQDCYCPQIFVSKFEKAKKGYRKHKKDYALCEHTFRLMNVESLVQNESKAVSIKGA